MLEHSQRTLPFVAMVSAILSTLFWVLYVLTAASSPILPELSEPIARLEALRDAQGTYLIYGWGGTLGAFLTIPYMFGIVHAMDDAGPQRWIALFAGVIGAVLTGVAFLSVSLSAIYYLLPSAEASPELAQHFVIAIETTLRGHEAVWFFGSFLAYGLAVAWIAMDALRTKTGPAWINWVGIFGGVAGIIWLRPFLDALMPIAAIGSILNIVLLSVWAIGLTISMWKNSAT